MRVSRGSVEGQSRSTPPPRDCRHRAAGATSLLGNARNIARFQANCSHQPRGAATTVPSRASPCIARSGGPLDSALGVYTAGSQNVSLCLLPKEVFSCLVSQAPRAPEVLQLPETPPSKRAKPSVRVHGGHFRILHKPSDTRRVQDCHPHGPDGVVFYREQIRARLRNGN